MMRRRHRDDDSHAHEPETQVLRNVDDGAAHDKYGGVNIGASFYGWLVSVALTVLLAGLAAAIASAVGATVDVTQTQAQREAGSTSIAGAAVLALILVIAYYAGGYVAGRMSRFDGARQGFVA